MSMKSRRFKRDDRGFKESGEVKCTYGSTARVKESSSAMSPKIWLFVEEDPAILREPKPGNAALHLDFKQARKLIGLLEDAMEFHYHLEK